MTLPMEDLSVGFCCLWKGSQVNDREKTEREREIEVENVLVIY